MKRKLKKTVTCRICGKRMQNLTVHLIKIHKMFVDEYKKEYDVDSVFADRLRARMSDVHRKHKSNRPYIPMTRKELLRSLVKID